MSALIPFAPLNCDLTIYRNTKGKILPRTIEAWKSLVDTSSNPFARGFIELGLLILFSRQTASEQQSGHSTELNGIGFGNHHDFSGTYYASRVGAMLLAGKRLGECIDNVPIQSGKLAGKATHVQGAARVVSRHIGQVIDVLSTIENQGAYWNDNIAPRIPELAELYAIADKRTQARIANQ